MWWKKYSGYKKPLDKLKQWTQVNKREYSKVKYDVLLAGWKKPPATSSVQTDAGRKAWRTGGSCRAHGGLCPCCPQAAPARDPAPQQGRTQARVPTVPPHPGVTPPSRGHCLEEGVSGRVAMAMRATGRTARESAVWSARGGRALRSPSARQGSGRAAGW